MFFNAISKFKGLFVSKIVQNKQPLTISVNELKIKMKSHKLILIDVRESVEHNEFNFGGENIPLSTIHKINQTKYLKESELYVYCRAGTRGSGTLAWKSMTAAASNSSKVDITTTTQQ